MTHQKPISRSIVDWHPPNIACDHGNYNLKRLSHFSKAYELAEHADKHLERHADAERVKERGQRRASTWAFRPTPLCPTFLTRCASTILIIWALNDIRLYLDPPEPLPRYTPPPPPPSSRRRLGRLFSRMTNITSVVDSPSASPLDANAQSGSFLLYIKKLALRILSELQWHLSTFDSTTNVSKLAISKPSRRPGMGSEVSYLLIGLSRTSRCGRHSNHHTDLEAALALQQSPAFLLSLVSAAQCERNWAWRLARRVDYARQSENSFDKWARIWMKRRRGRKRT